MPTIAQLSGTVDVQNLPGGPVLDRLVLENPVPTAVGLLIAAVIGAVALARSGRSKLSWAVVLGGGALAAAVVLAGAMVETTRERVTRGARAFVEAVAGGNTNDVAGMVDSRLTLRSGGSVIDQDRDWLVGVVAGMPSVITDHSVRMRGAALEGSNRARTRMTVRVRADAAYAGDVYSSWDLVWIRDSAGGPDGWRIAGIECLSIFGQEPDAGWVREGAEIARRGVGSGQ